MIRKKETKPVTPAQVLSEAIRQNLLDQIEFIQKRAQHSASREARTKASLELVELSKHEAAEKLEVTETSYTFIGFTNTVKTKLSQHLLGQAASLQVKAAGDTVEFHRFEEALKLRKVALQELIQLGAEHEQLAPMGVESPIDGDSGRSASIGGSIANSEAPRF